MEKIYSAPEEAAAPLSEEIPMPKWVRNGAIILALILIVDAVILILSGYNTIGPIWLAIGFIIRFIAALGLLLMRRWGAMIAGFMAMLGIVGAAIIINIAGAARATGAQFAGLLALFINFAIAAYLILAWGYFK